MEVTSLILTLFAIVAAARFYSFIRPRVHSNVNPIGERRYGLYVFNNKYATVFLICFGLRDIRFLITEGKQ